MSSSYSNYITFDALRGLALKNKELIRMRNQDSLKSYFTNESKSFNTKKIKEY